MKNNYDSQLQGLTLPDFLLVKLFSFFKHSWCGRANIRALCRWANVRALCGRANVWALCGRANVWELCRQANVRGFELVVQMTP